MSVNLAALHDAAEALATAARAAGEGRPAAAHTAIARSRLATVPALGPGSEASAHFAAVLHVIDSELPVDGLGGSR